MMKCKICTNAHLREINSRLIKGDVYQRIATDYGFSESAVRRHRANHLPASIQKGMELIKNQDNISAAESQINTDHLQVKDMHDIIECLNEMIVQTKDIYSVCRLEKQNLTALKSLDSLRGTYSLFLSMLEKAQATYEARLELAKMENKDDLKESNELAAERMKLLNDDEGYAFKRLLNKMLYDNKDIVISGGKIIPSLNTMDNPPRMF